MRLVAATHRDLQQLVDSRHFRNDLCLRLRSMEISLPPLRERGDHIRELALRLLEKSCRRLNRPTLSLNARAMERLLSYHWPGNVRELENAIERAVILSDSAEIDAKLFTLSRATEHPAAESDSLGDYFVRDHEQSLSETELARRLGISRKTLRERRQRLGIPRLKEAP